MEPPHEHSGLLAQIAVGATTILGWFWAVIIRNSKRVDEMNQANVKRLDEIQEKIQEHELETAKRHPTNEQMYVALKVVFEPLEKKLDETNSNIDKLIERELNKRG